jgi:hypothetical protein
MMVPTRILAIRRFVERPGWIAVLPGFFFVRIGVLTLLLYARNSAMQVKSVDFSDFCAYCFGMEKKRGRPPKGDKTQESRIYLRAIDAEKAMMESAAHRAGLTLSDWIRDRLAKAAHREMRASR